MITSLLRRWRPRHLLLSWCAYWVALILVKAGPALAAIWRLSQNADHGSVNVGVTDGIISANIVQAGQPAWSGSIAFTHLTLLVALPPLLLWMVWLASSSRTNNAGEMRLKNQTTSRGLNATEPRIGIIDTSSSTSKRREREEA